MPDNDLLAIDVADVVATIQSAIRRQVGSTLRRRGAVVALSGGVDSSVVGMLCAQALGPERVLGLLLPEQDTTEESVTLARSLATFAGFRTELVDVAPVLEAASCYQHQVSAVRRVIPEFDRNWAMKLVLPSVLDGERLSVYRLVARAPDGHEITVRLSSAAYTELVAATNMKQRVRKQTEYYFADRLQYAVAGTANRLEFDQGFFVKNGDGAADFKPIAHLYKSQVYALAEYFNLPAGIRHREPTTETFGLAQSQAEFYFSLDFRRMDLCLFGVNTGTAASVIAEHTGLTPVQVERVYRDIASKRRATRYLHVSGLLVEPVTEIG